MIIHDIVKIIIEKNETIDNKNDPSKIDKYDINLINSLLNNYTLNNNFFLNKKYKYVKQILENIFIENDMKDFFLESIQKIQKIYFSLNKFAFLWKFKKAKIIVQEDLYMNVIEPNAKNSIWIYQEKNKYLFILSDLINIINIALSNSPNFFSEPLSFKNPFNNIPFNKSTLYNIYFQILHFNKLVPMLFHLFFLSNFNLIKFKLDNEFIIREYAIVDYVNTKDENILCNDIIEMINSGILDNRKKIRIDIDFPKKKLVKIMRPYLLLYLKSKYSLSFYTQVQTGRELKNKLEKFYNYCPMFGRKKIELIEVFSTLRKKKIIKRVVNFVEKYPPFNHKEENFLQSHFVRNNVVENNLFHHVYEQEEDDNQDEDDEDEDDQDEHEQDDQEYEHKQDDQEEDDQEDEDDEDDNQDDQEDEHKQDDEDDQEDDDQEDDQDDQEEDDQDNVIQVQVSEENDNNHHHSYIITYHTDVDIDYFNEIYEQMYQETKEEDSIS